MPSVNLKNISIKKLQDKNFNDYFLIVNQDNQNEAYFCFEKAVKEGWQELVSNWENIREVEIEFEEQEKDFKTYRKVISFYSPEGEILI